MLSFDHNCPRCASWKIYQSRFRSVERLLTLALLRPVRCGECDMRYYRPIFYAALQRWHYTRTMLRRETLNWVPVRAERPSSPASHLLDHTVELPEQNRTA
jgi:hypothetical protein